MNFSEKFDEMDIVANLFILLLGGFESTSAALSFCIYELALNEKIQRNLRLEVQRVKDEFGELNYESFRKMSYLDAVMAGTSIFIMKKAFHTPTQFSHIPFRNSSKISCTCYCE